MLDQVENTRHDERLAPSPFVHFSDVSLVLNKSTIIKNINCSIESIGITVVLGPNGAGKSLFLRLLAGLILPTSGTINCSGRAPDDQTILEQILVFQDPVMLRRSTFENMAFVLRQKKLPKAQIHAKVMQALGSARLESVVNSPARKLSGGEQQRLALARALVVEPDVLLLDEPTASLDPASTSVVEDMITNADTNGTKIILVTHDIKQAKRLADNIMFMSNGCILAQTEADEFFREPGSNEAQCYLDGRLPQ